MARTRQRAFLVDQGFLLFRRCVRCITDVWAFFAEVARAERICLTEMVTRSLSLGRAPHRTVTSTLQCSSRLQIAVDSEASSASGHPGLLGHLRRHARRYRHLFSEMEADIIARTLSGWRTEPVLDAAYGPSGDLLDIAGDILLGRFVARSTTAVLAVRLGRAMAQAVSERQCSAWTSPTAIGEAA